jgi:hypothetical protein
MDHWSVELAENGVAEDLVERCTVSMASEVVIGGHLESSDEQALPVGDQEAAERTRHDSGVLRMHFGWAVEQAADRSGRLVAKNRTGSAAQWADPAEA